MIRTVLVDDEPPARRKLKHLLAAQPDFLIAGEAESAAEAIDLLNRERPDLVFLDIGLPDASGFDVVAGLSERAQIQIVFVTAFDEFALRAFEVHALDYLLKPVEPSRFAKALERFRLSLRAGSSRRLDHLIAALEAERKYARRLLIQDDGRSVFVEVERIDWIESARNYACIHAGVHTHIQRSTLDAFQAKLDPAVFRRVSRAHIVNVARIAEIRPWFHGDSKIVLTDATEITWSRRYRPESLQELERA
jgi:two-component system LytT family response regulator